MASSSSATDSSIRYDVFLSFRGTDTRNNFTSHLYQALCQAQIRAFIDYKIDRGEEITPFLERVIEDAKISIIIFSPDYASSTYCLDELLKIMQCRELKAQLVLPIFYKVDPSEKIFQEAFARHKANFKRRIRHRKETVELEKKVQRWESTFAKTLELAGWHIDKNSNEAEIIGKITIEVLEKLRSSQSRGEELISTSMVGWTTECIFGEIWHCLMNDETSRVGVYGMGGVGKTTIVTHINNQLLKVPNSFAHIYWVTVSKDSSIYKLQTDMAKVINLDLSKEDDERKRAAKLWKELESKKFVLILDDVWEPFELEVVGIPIVIGGGKLLLTTRKLRVCERMECHQIKLKPLSKFEAWDLFIRESRYHKNESPEWRGMVESVVKECGGLPLAIVVVARTLKGIKEISEWEDVLRELKKPCEGQNHEMEEQVFKPLKVSYDRLLNDSYRRCFLYCSLFPEDYLLSRQDLVEYWIGEGLVDELSSRQAQLNNGNRIANELIRSSLLEQLDRPGFDNIKMHDVIRDMAHIINLKVGLRFHDPVKEVEWSFEVGCVEVLDHRKLSCVPNSAPTCFKMRTLLLREYREIPNCLFANMQSLTVLDMHDVYLIPDSISNLGNLRVLILCECHSLKSMPSLVGLENLQYLKISETGLKKIPKGVERFVNLRVLNLSQNYSLSGSLPSAILEKLSHLQSLQLEDGDVKVEPEALMSLKKLEMLRLKFYDLHKLISYIKSGYWQRLVEYHIYYVVHGGCFLPESWKKAMYLEEIGDIGEWKGELAILVPDGIQQLKFVHWECSMFDILKNKTFANLQRIDIRWYKDRYLFTPTLAQQLLQNVKELTITNDVSMGKLEEIIAAAEQEECANQRNYNYPAIVLPKLKILRLRHLPKLRSIYRGRMLCSSLECIDIYCCRKLKRLSFCTEENQQNPTIKLRGRNSWWNSLLWDNSIAKSMYRQEEFVYESE